MRLLHTSDWHIGRTFHGRDLLADQREVLSGLADLVAAEGIDVVLIAGDLYDRAVPSTEAVRVCTEVLGAIRAAGAQIVLISGNHDSAPRLAAFAEFAAAGGLHVRARIAGLDEPVLLTDEHGQVAIYGLPYLEPDIAREPLGTERGHAAVLGAAMDRVRADLAGRDARSVVLAHAFVTGGQGSESERKIAVGGVEDVPGSTFDGVDYVALGHLHGRQVLAEHLRYSGSPLAYSFSEINHHKSAFIVELDATGLAEVRTHELPVPRRLATLSGELDDLLADPAHDTLVDCYLSVVLTDRARPLDAMRKLQARFPYAAHVEWRPEGGLPQHQRYAQRVKNRTDTELTANFVTDCRNSPPTEAEQALLDEALREVAEVAK
ncbi:exonuclease SbcCD subunit D [Pseudonocardiaceae bacterium YIM PH 21723]|nr:exonuclease SbcCD subunit D [Pseudonocardiaceae bacterium YIM PH 21723]